MSWEDIPGWAAFRTTYDEYIAEAQDGDVVVEIGVLFGKSLAYLVEGLTKAKRDVTVYAVDPWTWGSTREAIQPNIYQDVADKLGGPFNAFTSIMHTHAREELERVRIIKATSLEARPMFRDRSLAMVMIDGDHGFVGCSADINAWRSAVRPGGLLAGDDYHPVNFPPVVAAVKACLPEGVNIDGTTWRYRVTEDEVKGQWAIVETVGGARWCGRLVSSTEGAAVTMQPAFEMAPSKLMFPKPVGGHGYDLASLDIEPVCWAPLDFAHSTPATTLRWASLTLVSQLHPDDQNRFFTMIKTATRTVATDGAG